MDLNNSVTAGGISATSVISAQCIVLGHSGGTTFTVDPGAANGINLKSRERSSTVQIQSAITA